MAREHRVEQATATWFAEVVDQLCALVRARGLVVPGFRSPPRIMGVRRTIGRRSDGAVVVAVATKGRPGHEIVADLVDGVLAANRMSGPRADDLRSALIAALIEFGVRPVRAA